MPIQLQLGLEVIQSYKRLSYTAWHALAELVDNATQSYFDHRAELDSAYASSGDRLTIGVVYDRSNGGMLRVSDNALGMSYDELTYALKVGFPPANTSGRSKFGMGMKTSACWIGNNWTIRTKRLGETTEHSVTVDVNTVAGGKNDLPHTSSEGHPPELHYTVIEIREHNREFYGRTLGRIKDFLRSMYRQDLRSKLVTIEWQGTALEWDDSEYVFLKAVNGEPYRKDFGFQVGGKHIHGWVGILERGSRARAGFSILQADRVVRGWPESWRPESLYGQFQGSNDLINQRLIGEINLDEFQVSHTKDNILWLGDEEEEVQRLLKEHCGAYAEVAKRARKETDDERRPSEAETQAAIDELVNELSSVELADLIGLEPVPPPEAVAQAFQALTKAVVGREPTFKTVVAQFEVLGYLLSDGSVNDPYVVVDSTRGDQVKIIINTRHPHWLQLVGGEGVLNYLRHCTYDGIAEWQARHKASRLDPDTIKILKDKLLRLPLEIETHQPQEVEQQTE
jgi:hypothetical protein